MGWTIAVTADGIIKYPQEEWAEIQADANARGEVNEKVLRLFEEYYCARTLGLPPREAWGAAVRAARGDWK